MGSGDWGGREGMVRSDGGETEQVGRPAHAATYTPLLNVRVKFLALLLNVLDVSGFEAWLGSRLL
jgi:hypothetical protein